MKYSRARRDINQKPIVEFLRVNGAQVIDLAAVGELPDLLVHHKGFVSFIEIKQPGNSTPFKWVQLNWISKSKFNVGICTTEKEALDLMQKKTSPLSQRQKDRLNLWLQSNIKTNYPAKTIFEVLGEP